MPGGSKTGGGLKTKKSSFYLRSSEAPGGVGSPFKTMLSDTFMGSSALKQLEEEENKISSAEGKINEIVGDVSSAIGDIGGGVGNLMKVLGFRPTVVADDTEPGKGQMTESQYKEEYGELSGLGLTIDEKKAAKKIGVSEYQWKTGAAGNARLGQKIKRAKLGLIEGGVTESKSSTDAVTTDDADATTTEIIAADDATTEIINAVTNPNSLVNLQKNSITKEVIGGYEEDDIIAIQQEMIDISGKENLLGATKADGDWGDISQKAYQWYLDGNDLKDFVYKTDKELEEEAAAVVALEKEQAFTAITNRALGGEEGGAIGESAEIANEIHGKGTYDIKSGSYLNASPDADVRVTPELSEDPILASVGGINPLANDLVPEGVRKFYGPSLTNAIWEESGGIDGELDGYWEGNEFLNTKAYLEQNPGMERTQHYAIKVEKARKAEIKRKKKIKAAKDLRDETYPLHSDVTKYPGTDIDIDRTDVKQTGKYDEPTSETIKQLENNLNKKTGENYEYNSTTKKFEKQWNNQKEASTVMRYKNMEERSYQNIDKIEMTLKPEDKHGDYVEDPNVGGFNKDVFLTHSYDKNLGGWVVYVNGELLREGTKTTTGKKARSKDEIVLGTPVVFTKLIKSATRQQIHDYLLEKLKNGDFQKYRYLKLLGNYSPW